MICNPVQADDKKTEHVGKDLGKHPHQGRSQACRRNVWNPDVQDQQRDDDRVDTVGEGFESLLVQFSVMFAMRAIVSFVMFPDG